jgi:hypothetical protein
MQTASLPLEILISIVNFALDADDDDPDRHYLGRIGVHPEWRMPNLGIRPLKRRLKRKLRQRTPIVITEPFNICGTGAETGEIKTRIVGVIDDAEEVNKPTVYSYNVTMALQLYVIIVF